VRLLYVCCDPGVPLLGAKGASVHARSVTAALTRLGHHVAVACASVGQGNPAPPGVPIHELPAAPERAGERIAELIAEYDAQAILERYSLASGPARGAAGESGVPLVLEVNAPLVREAARHRGLTGIPEAQERERQAFAGADAIGAVSRAVLAHVRRTAPDGPRPRWIPNGVEVERFAAAAPTALGLSADTVKIGFVGSMKPWHGVADLLDAIGDLPVELVLAGHGPLLDELRRASAGDRRVHILGDLPHDRIPGLLRSLDIGAAPYLPDEDFYFSPLKVLEYLAAGLPVVCPRVGDLPELVGEAGILYEVGDRVALSEALARLANDRELRVRAAGQARLRAARWSWARNAAAYAELARDAAAVTADLSQR
jgi:glycosyltransferase involved in cell wall biosynthesis